MILTLNTKFEGYIPVQVLGKSTSYREVYLAKNGFEQDVILTVYDMSKLPKCFVDGKIPELEIIPQLANDAFPKYVERGTYNNDKASLCWMATKFIGHTTLKDYILSDYVRNEHEMLLQFYNLLVAVKELSWRMGGSGCCNNISTDNIIVVIDEIGDAKWHIVGLDCVSEVCRGRATFDTDVPSRLFRAPETLVGHYNIRTDIFSLGIVLAFILQGKHPWSDYDVSDTHIPTAAMVKLMRDNAPTLMMPDALKSIVAKAIATKPSERYKCIEDFGTAIARYLGNENLSSFECFAPVHSKPVATPPETKIEEETADIMKQQAPPQPKTNVKIERVKGNGFKDVAGMNQLKSKLSRNFVDIVQNRELAVQFQITPPNGILLWGPPGTGKTFISRKLAEESGMLFSLVKPSDLGNIYIHGSQSMIADLFTRSEELAAKNNCGVLLVFDEFDSLVPKRGVNDDNNQANEVAEFLTRLNDCAEKNVFVVATTNRIEAIDPAITRKGRMDEIIYVGLPDEEARKELFEIELLKRPHEDIDTAHIVDLTEGYSSSDISFIVKECARCSFEESVKAKHLVKISQALLEKTIAETCPSVTGDELKQFERIKESFLRGQKNERPRIGFVR